MYSDLFKEIIYRIIKFRKRKINIDYLDNERIFGYDYLTYSKAFDDKMSELFSRDNLRNKIIEYVDLILMKDDFDVEKPLKGVNRSMVNYLSYFYNDIDDYLIESEKNIIKRIRNYDLDSFMKLNIDILGFNNEVNNLLKINGIFSIKNLEDKKDTISIDDKVKKIVYTKYYMLKKIIYNVDFNDNKYIPISLLFNNDFKTFNELRFNGIYTVNDFCNEDLDGIRCIDKINDYNLYILVKKIRSYGIKFYNEKDINMDLNTIRGISISNNIKHLYHYFNINSDIISIDTIGDLERLGYIDVNDLDVFMLYYFKYYYLNDFLVSLFNGVKIENNKNIKKLIK